MGRVFALLMVMVLAACSVPEATRAPIATVPAESQTLAAVPTSDSDELAQAIMALSPEVDPEEARRAAQIAFAYPLQLARNWGVDSPPIFHNMRVNSGKRPRGLCYHWAEEMDARLKAENFETLVLFRAIANSQNIRLEHSTAIISARGEGMNDGIILDPWRKGYGRLHWDELVDDTKYFWEPRRLVLDRKNAEKLSEEQA